MVTTLQRQLSKHEDPRAFGKPMIGNWTGYWRYRVGDHRAVCRIEDGIVTVFVIQVAHRREAYR